MITRIEVDGFKSLRGFVMDLEPFTVLIGPNSAGKSNVLDAIGLLSRLASMPIAEAFKQGRGKAIDQFSRHGGEVAGAIRFAVEALEYGLYPPEQEFQSRFRYELTIERHALPSGAEKLALSEESLRAMRREDDTWIPAHPAFATYAGYEVAGEDCLITLTADFLVANGLPPRPPESLPTHTRLIRDGCRYPTAGFVEHNLAGWRMLDSWTARLGEPSERIDTGKLAPDASNLPTILAEVPPSVLGEIRADLVSLVPGIASFDVTPEGDEIRLDFELSGGERMPARLVSAGTLHILALLTALRMKPLPFALCIEEPENGIYPARLRALLDLLRDASTRSHEEQVHEYFEKSWRGRATGLVMNQLPTQILLTTHSPVALAALRSHPEHLRFIDMVRRNGERITRVRTVGKPGAGDRGRLTISPREIDALLHAARSEEPEG